MVSFITSYIEMNYQIYLAVIGKTGYILTFTPDRGVGSACPCCMFDEHRAAIMQAVEKALGDGTVIGKVRWVSFPGQTYGDRIHNKFPPLRQELFCDGSVGEITDPIKEELQKAALELC